MSSLGEILPLIKLMDYFFENLKLTKKNKLI